MSIQFIAADLSFKCLPINLRINFEDWPPPDPLWHPSLPHKNFTECLWGKKLYMSGISILFDLGEKNMEKTTGDLTTTAIHYFSTREAGCNIFYNQA